MDGPKVDRYIRTRFVFEVLFMCSLLISRNTSAHEWGWEQVFVVEVLRSLVLQRPRRIGFNYLGGCLPIGHLLGNLSCLRMEALPCMNFAGSSFYFDTYQWKATLVLLVYPGSSLYSQIERTQSTALCKAMECQRKKCPLINITLENIRLREMVMARFSARTV